MSKFNEDNTVIDQVDPDDRPRLRRRSLAIPVAIVIALTACSGLVHGMLDGRWSSSEDLVARGNQLQNVPESCGNWVEVEKSQLEDKSAEVLRVYGSTVRSYRHQSTGSTVTVAVLFGPRGPIAVHTPEICYSSVSKSQCGERKTKELIHSENVDSFWSVQFKERHAVDPDPTLDLSLIHI